MVGNIADWLSFDPILSRIATEDSRAVEDFVRRAFLMAKRHAASFDWDSKSEQSIDQSANDNTFSFHRNVYVRFGFSPHNSLKAVALILALHSGDPDFVLSENWLCWAVEMHDSQTLKLLLACGNGGEAFVSRDILIAHNRIDPSFKDNWLLRRACEVGAVEIVCILLDPVYSCDPTSCNNMAIQNSCKNGHSDVVSLLLKDSRIDPAVNDNFPLRIAAENGHLNIVAMLLASEDEQQSSGTFHTLHKKTNNFHPDTGTLTSISAMPEYSSFSFEELRLQDYSNFDRTKTRKNVNTVALGNYALLKASENGHVQVVSLLLFHSAVLSTISHSNAPLVKAAQNGHAEVVSRLLLSGMDPSLNCNEALIAAVLGDYGSVIQVLLNDHRIDPSADFNFAILKAVEMNCHEAISILSKDKRVNLTDTPLDLPSKKCQGKALLDQNPQEYHGFSVIEESMTGGRSTVNFTAITASLENRMWSFEELRLGYMLSTTNSKKKDNSKDLLREACEKGNLAQKYYDIVIELLSHSEWYNLVNETSSCCNETLLESLVQDSDAPLDLIEHLLVSGARVSFKDQTGNSEIALAACSARFEFDILQLLLRYIPDNESRSNYLEAALSACLWINTKAAMELIRLGAKFHSDPRNLPLFKHALRSKDTIILETFLTALPNGKNNILDDNTYLLFHYAITADPHCVAPLTTLLRYFKNEILTNKISLLETAGNRNLTLLEVILDFGHSDAVYFLVNEFGVDLNNHINPVSQVTPLYFVSMKENTGMLELLLSLNADPNQLIPLNGQSILHHVAQLSEKAIEILLANGASITKRAATPPYQTPVHSVCAMKSQNNIIDLITRTQSGWQTMQDADGNTPLHTFFLQTEPLPLIFWNPLECLFLLLLRGASWSVRNSAGLTAFDIAPNSAKTLLARWIAINNGVFNVESLAQKCTSVLNSENVVVEGADVQVQNMIENFTPRIEARLNSSDLAILRHLCGKDTSPDLLEALATEWICQKCTVPNKQKNAKCLFCDAVKGAERIVEPNADWNCPLCLVPNISTSTVCVACESEYPRLWNCPYCLTNGNISRVCIACGGVDRNLTLTGPAEAFTRYNSSAIPVFTNHQDPPPRFAADWQEPLEQPPGAPIQNPFGHPPVIEVARFGRPEIQRPGNFAPRLFPALGEIIPPEITRFGNRLFELPTFIPEEDVAPQVTPPRGGFAPGAFGFGGFAPAAGVFTFGEQRPVLPAIERGDETRIFPTATQPQVTGFAFAQQTVGEATANFGDLVLGTAAELTSPFLPTATRFGQQQQPPLERVENLRPVPQRDLGNGVGQD
ncbi:hypothetical protein HK100_005591 [Physocladia obscura]|uniref:RanBP2-type domain-containing protein n=1 Tax=Physocladia obscura TaxID=109957 RepID=A0AAD5SX54_9FUNG|nr:hypothetical protein HK100_005591 [Physocladia obscura]